MCQDRYFFGTEPYPNQGAQTLFQRAQSRETLLQLSPEIRIHTPEIKEELLHPLRRISIQKMLHLRNIQLFLQCQPASSQQLEPICQPVH